MTRPRCAAGAWNALVLLPVLLGGCLFAGSTSGSGQGPSPCPAGQACTDAAGHAGVCDGQACEVTCTLGMPNCCLASPDCAGLGQGVNAAYCDQATGACLLVCNGNRDCATLSHVAGTCHGAGCVCDEGSCVTPPCSTDADCTGGHRCVAGTCGAGIAATACEILPGPVTVTPGAARPLTALASDASGTGRAGTPVAWSSSDPGVATVDAATGEVTGGAQGGLATITAATGAARCTVPVHNLGALGAEDLRVTALDPVTHGGLAGVTVVARQNGADLATAVTGGDGVADLPGIPPGPVDVDVLDLAGASDAAPNGRTWVTLAGVRARDLLVPLPANPDFDAAGGVQGAIPVDTFSALSTDSVHMAFVGFSWPGPLDAVDLRRLSGPFEPTSFQLFGEQVDATFYSGLELGVGDTLWTGTYAPVGVSGRRVLWALVGNAPLDRWTQRLGPVLGSIVGGSPSTVSAGDLAAGLLPSFDAPAFTAFTRPATTVTPIPLKAGGADLASFPKVAVTPGPALRHGVTVDLPRLPSPVSGRWGGGILALPGVFVDGEGFTPLGLDLGVDVLDPSSETADGVIDGLDGLPNGEMMLRYAPPSAGLEAETPWLLLVAGSPESLAGGAAGADASRSTRLVPLAGVTLGATVDASAPMLPPPTGARWDGSARTATATFPDGATLHRWDLEGALGHRWVVLAPAGAAAVTLPDEAARCPAAGCVDPAASPARAFAEALVLGGGLTYDDLVTLDGEDLDRLPRLALDTSRTEVLLR